MPDQLEPLWDVPVGDKISPPTIADDQVFVSLVDEQGVVALNTRNGQKQWEFTAGGRVDSPPTYHQGTVLFGSADGWVYCLRARDGDREAADQD